MDNYYFAKNLEGKHLFSKVSVCGGGRGMNKRNIRWLAVTSCILTWLVILSSFIFCSSQVVMVTIGSDGIANIELNATVAAGLNQILLPIEPIPETINVMQDGKSIPPIYYNRTLIIPAEENGTVTIKYIANVTVLGGKITLEVGKADVILKVMKGVILLSLPENIIEAQTKNGMLIIRFIGPAKISYTITKAPTTAPETTVTPPAIPWWLIVIPICVVIVVILVFVFLRRGSRELGHLDEAILKVLREKGGKMLQSELVSELGVPKTTLWRHVKKLEALGYVEVERIGRVNVVKLK